AVSLGEARDLAGAMVLGREPPRDISAPDPEPTLRAAAILASALDASLPGLRRAAADAPAPAHSGAGCDVLDAPPLCVGGTGSNTYSEFETVVIDLGGDDVYKNNAGGAEIGVAAVLDLAGNDRYEAPPRQFVSQGAGSLGGVGMLVDLAGNDVYSDDAGGPEGDGFALAQGFGQLGGAGFLVDAAGDDSYTLATSTVGRNAGSAGHGYGFVGGIGGVLDGGGDDRYLQRARVTPEVATIEDVDEEDNPVGTRTVTRSGAAQAAGQGVGVVGGAGYLIDSGGTDELTLDSEVLPAPATWPETLVPLDAATRAPQVFSTALGQAYAGLGGVGLLVQGPGRTSYRIRAVFGEHPLSEPNVRAAAGGQAYSAFGGIAVLSDAGGADLYDSEVAMASARELRATDGCACGEPIAAAAGPTASWVQGYGLTGTLALLDDGGGDDTYRSRAANTARVIVRDDRTTTGEPLSARAESATLAHGAQGAGNVGDGVAVLFDHGGNDTYAHETTVSVSADGSSSAADKHPKLGVALAPPSAYGQGGVGHGAVAGDVGQSLLLDVGGSDTYTAAVVATTDEDGLVTPAAGSFEVQGASSGQMPSSGLGLAIDLDAGTGQDTYRQSPAVPACQGARGGEFWVDCGSTGAGVNR
ncbi:MAG: hypothetical protein M3245_04405, partial [Actinomycetota bacterium]|nr:hypothetical protein [Actinomycetota bacterium]